MSAASSTGKLDAKNLTDEQIEIIIINGFLIHSFNAMERDYLMRILRYRIETMTNNVDQEELAWLAERVVEYYTKKGTCIAFIAIRDIIDKAVYAVQCGMCGEDCLRKFCTIMSKPEKRESPIFTNREKDIQEVMHSGNFVTLSSSLAFANFPNVYNLKQQYLESMGVSNGTLVHYKDCTAVTTMRDYPSVIQKYYKKI